MKTLSILLIEDNSGDERLIHELLREIHSFGCKISVAQTVRQGVEQIQKNTPDIILLDLNLPDSKGQKTFDTIHSQNKEIPIVLVSGLEDEELSVQLIQLGAQDYISKANLDSRTLERAIAYSIERNKLRNQINNELKIRQAAEEKVYTLNLELEQRVKLRTGQLERANRELEAFSYSVSHDLRAPLRHINGYAGILKSDFGEQLPGDVLMQINSIIGATQKMETLIEDLLSFSRTGRTELKCAPLNMNRAVKDAMTRIMPSVKDRIIEWNISDLPEVTGDFNLIRQVWVNLLDNAVKYTGTRKKAFIQIDYTNEKEELVFCIHDNGVGFDMKFVQKLFNVFQRLHPGTEFEGTGIGLANVSRIIARHGGRTWAEGEVDKGAAFYFSLPKKVNATVE